jgi:hypothetical protein
LWTQLKKSFSKVGFPNDHPQIAGGFSQNQASELQGTCWAKEVQHKREEWQIVACVYSAQSGNTGKQMPNLQRM